MEYAKAMASELEHKDGVRTAINCIIVALLERGNVHDADKLSPEMLPCVERQLSEPHADYGSAEHAALVEKYADFRARHFAVNRHHPEHFSDGMCGMNIVDLVEMLCDWKAASDRCGNTLERSVEINIDKYEIGEPLASILRNSAALLSAVL